MSRLDIVPALTVVTGAGVTGVSIEVKFVSTGVYIC